MKAVAAVLLGMLAVALAGPQPQFPNDWSANEVDELIVYQGDFTQSGDNYCCSDQSNCQIQTEYQNGMSYMDYTHNRTRFDDSVAQQTIISDFAIQREMLVDPSSMVCQEYCPMEGDILTPGFLDPNATDMGSVQVQGKTYEKWQWSDTIFAKIVMDTVTVLVDQSQNPAIPYNQVEVLTPFGGPAIGQEASTWTNFKPGTPAASLFAVKNVASCQMSPNCGNGARQLHRLRIRALHTWTKWHQINNQKKFKKLLKSEL
jgi:hypothetical protein